MNLNSQFDLKNLSNDRLMDGLKRKVSEERALLMEILYGLQEVEVRKLHLQMGYPDLYTFAQKELGYSAGAAYRRIMAMRLLKSLPEIAPKLQSGELGLENASQAQSFFRKEDERRKHSGEDRLTLEIKREVVTELFEKSTREGLRILTEKSPEVMLPVEKTKPLHNDQTLVQFVASKELMEKLEELKGLLAHQNYEGRLDALVEKLADLGLKQYRPKTAPKVALKVSEKSSSPKALPINLKKDSPRFLSNALKEADQDTSELLSAFTAASGAASSSPAQGMEQRERSGRDEKEPIGTNLRHPPTQKRSRYIPAQVRHVVLRHRAQGCSYQDPKTKRACGSKHGLQFDHIQPFSQGGAHTPTNLRLLCGAHNRFRF